MISIKCIPKKVKAHSCDNCNRVMPIILEYSFGDYLGTEFNKLMLCEDCSNALANLHFECMISKKSYRYHKDEIEKLEVE